MDIIKKASSSSNHYYLRSCDNFDTYFVALLKPNSIETEQYRELRRHVLEAGKNNSSKIFLVSSAVHGEGKTITAINLAISVVNGLHENVLLIDADLRKPNVSVMLGLEKDTKGLAEYLTFGGDLANFINKTSIPKLSVITSGLPPENPSELLNSKYMSDLIKDVKHRYDDRYIIIDSPPLMPVTDATILSYFADKVILIIKASATNKQIVNEAINKIKNKEKILGLVLNGHKTIAS